eukprot:scaffold27065_cov30-Cyclotella_meneghiniana.AAC.2
MKNHIIITFLIVAGLAAAQVYGKNTRQVEIIEKGRDRMAVNNAPSTSSKKQHGNAMKPNPSSYVASPSDANKQQGNAMKPNSSSYVASPSGTNKQQGNAMKPNSSSYVASPVFTTD